MNFDKTLISIIISCSILTKLFGQELDQQLYTQGVPLIENFYEGDYEAEATNYNITCSDNNFIYVLNPRGILEYDGIQWRNIHPYLSSTKDRIHYFDNKLFYIKEKSIGFLYPDINGNFIDSVLAEGDNLNKTFATHKIHNNGEEAYIITEKDLYIWSPGKSLIKVPAHNNLCASVIFNHQLILNDYPNGLFRLEANELVPYFTDALLENNRVYDLTVKDSSRLILNIIYQGLHELNDNKLTNINNAVDYFGTGVNISESQLIYSTMMNGLINLNKTSSLNGLINFSIGLADNNVIDICLDNNKDVWAATRNGISHLATGLPITVYNKSTGLLSQIENVVQHKKNVYVCTKNGLFRINNVANDNLSITRDQYRLAEEIQGIDALCYNVYSFDNYLLLSAITGLYVIDGLQAIPLKNYNFKDEPGAFKYLFLKTFSGYAFYSYKNKTIARTRHQNWMFKDLVFGKEKVWYADSNSVTEVKVFRDRFEKTTFSMPKDLTDKKSYFIFSDSTDLYLSERGRVHKYLSQKAEWIIDSAFQSILDTNKMVVNCYYNNTDRKMLLSISDQQDYNEYTTALYSKENNRFQIETNLSTYLGNTRINTVFIQSENLWWIGTKDELYAFNPLKAKNMLLKRKAAIRKVVHSGIGKTIWLGYKTSQQTNFPFSKDELSFQFITSALGQQKGTKYSYILEGYQDKWTSFNSNNQVNYTNLREGNYTLRVKALFNDGEISDDFSYSFSIKPPWHRSVIAYLGYLALILIIGYLIFRWRLYYIQQDRKRLEQKITLRTEQLNKTNKELIDKTRELEEMDKVKSNFFANISHELRTPLTLILGPLKNLISKEKNKEKLSEYQVMERNSMMLKQHIEQFLELSKIESGNQALNLQTIELNGFVRRVMAAFQSLASIKNITLSIHNSDSEIFVSIDEKNMEIVLNNLLSNAIKFTPAEGNVSILLNPKETQVEIRIKDTGIGIEEQHLPFIFKRFYQADTSSSKKFEGTGIGLALSKEIIEMHQGTINVISEIGIGTQFTLSLPLSPEKDLPEIQKDDISVPNSIEDQTYYESEDSEPLSDAPIVLVVEDNADMQNYLKKLLQERFEVHLANNGEEGFIRAKELNPHLIVSDVMMPVKDGFSMVDDIRSVPEISHIPIIMLTARADEESKLKGLRKGVEEYLSKPFSKEELIIRINNIIKRRSATREKITRKLTLEPQDLELTSLDEQFLIKTGKLIEENISNADFDIQLLSDLLNISRRHLHRKVKLLTDMSPSEFVRSYRLKKAAIMLKQKVDSVSQIAYAVGFDDLSYFTKSFKAQFGKTPSEFGG